MFKRSLLSFFSPPAFFFRFFFLFSLSSRFFLAHLLLKPRKSLLLLASHPCFLSLGVFYSSSFIESLPSLFKGILGGTVPSSPRRRTDQKVERLIASTPSFLERLMLCRLYGLAVSRQKERGQADKILSQLQCFQRHRFP